MTASFWWVIDLLMSMPVGDARAVGDDQRGTRPGIRFEQRLRRLEVVGAHRDLGDVDVAVRARDRAEVLLGRALAGRRELRHGAPRRRLGRLAAGVRVDLGVEDEDVDVATRREDLVDAAEADVVGPAVAADDPDALADEIAGEGEQVPGVRGQRTLDVGEAPRAGGPPARAGARCPPRCPGRLRGVRRRGPRRAPARGVRRAGGRDRSARRARAASRARTPRCPRTASCSRPDRARRR